MASTQNPYSEQLRSLAELMLAVSGESVSIMKRNAPQQALKLKRQDEWGVYLEFLKILFNLSDRLSVLYLPIQAQPQFMDDLVDVVTIQLKKVLEPAFGAGADQMEVVLTIGKSVTESRQTYESYRFLLTEDSKAKNDMFEDFGKRVAVKMGLEGNARIASAASLCASAVLPALSAILQGQSPQPTAVRNSDSHPIQVSGGTIEAPTGVSPTSEIKLISVMASITGEEVETRWGLHPRFKQDLGPEESQELARFMNRVAKILGERYAAVAFSDEWTSWHQAGHA